MIIQKINKLNIILPNNNGYKTKNAITNILHVKNVEIKVYHQISN